MHPISYYFFKGILPVLIWAFASAGLYQFILEVFGRPVAVTSIPLIFAGCLYGLYKSCLLIMKD